MMFDGVKNKINFYKRLIIEVIETLCTICLIMESETRNYRYRSIMRSHFTELKKASDRLKEDLGYDKN